MLSVKRMKNKFKTNIKKNKWIYITFLVASLIITTIYILQGIAPFGKNTMLDVDFYHQYGPLLNELYDRVKSGETLIYSFNTGGGIPFYRNFLNYLSSPFNIILFLFKKRDIVMAFSVIIGLKAIMGATAMSYFLKKTFHKDDYFLCVFGILYAFSGYFCAYYWNIMWLDGMVFLPLIMYGINRLIDDNNPIIYIVFLAVMLLANYFIAYMICIYAVIYFGVYLYFHLKKGYLKNLKTLLIFIISSLLAAGLMAVFLIPLYKALSSISATHGGYPTTAFNFNIQNYLFNHLSGVSRTVFASDPLPLPNVYCGVLTLVLILTLFMNGKINIEVKVLALLSLIFFYVCFNIAIIDYMWHAFHVPNDLPWRYSFLYVFTLIILAYYANTKRDSLKKPYAIISYFLILVMILCAYYMNFKNTNLNKTIICAAFVLGYFLLYVLSNIKEINQKLMAILTILVVSIEAVFGININWNINHDLKTFMSDKDDCQNLVKAAKKIDNDFYRTEKTSYLTLNDGAWYDYYAMTTFTSMAYENTAKFQRMIGLGGNNINSYYYKYFETPVYNVMFNVRYIIGDTTDNNYYDFVTSNASFNLTRFKYPSSIMYVLNNDVKKWHLEEYNPFKNQEKFISLGTGIKDVYKGATVTKVVGANILDDGFYKNSNGTFSYTTDSNNFSNAITFTVHHEKSKNLYLYVGGANVSSFMVDGKVYSINSDEYYVVDTGLKNNEDTDVTITLKNANTSFLYFYAYTISDDNFNKFYNVIKDNSLNVKKYRDTLIEGDLYAIKNGTSFTTLSYDKGWQVFVDGKKVKTYKLANTYLGFDIKKGNHKIKFIYYPDGMQQGLLISTISSVLLIIYIWLFLKKDKKDK